jgi:uncharacterized protein YbaR (Trm112 family)
MTLLDDLADSQPQKSERAYQALVAQGEKELPCLIGALVMKKYESIREQILQVITNIGKDYPIEDVIPVLLLFLKDSNRPIYHPTYETLLHMGEKVVYNAYDILTYGWSDDTWVYNVCSLLLNVNSEHLGILVTPLLHLLEIGTEDNCLDESAIALLGKIGSPKANVAMPFLREKILGQNREDIRLASIVALQSFDPSTVQPFAPDIEKCLIDDSEEIRNSARKLLEILNK